MALPVNFNAYMTWAFFVVIVAVGAVDLYLALYAGPGATITEYIRRVSHQYPIIPFAAGVLAGHLFWTCFGQ